MHSNWDLAMITVPIIVPTSFSIVAPTTAVAMISPCPTTHTSLSTISQSSFPVPPFFDLLENIYATCYLRAKPLIMLDLLPGAPAWTTTRATNPCPLGGVWCPYWLLIIFSSSGAPAFLPSIPLPSLNFPSWTVYPSCLPPSINIIHSHVPPLRLLDPHVSALI